MLPQNITEESAAHWIGLGVSYNVVPRLRSELATTSALKRCVSALSVRLRSGLSDSRESRFACARVLRLSDLSQALGRLVPVS